MQWLMSHMESIKSVLLIISESSALVCLVLYPDNKGVSGVLAAIVKALKNLGAKEPTLPPA